MRVDAIGERAMVARLLDIYARSGSTELGDDCGLVPLGEDFLLVTTDTIRPGVHAPVHALPELLGWHLAAVNLSDIAAMGGSTLGLVTALTIPPDTEVEIVEGVARGVAECGSKYGVPLIGGDTKEGEGMVLAGTAVGRVPRTQVLRRRGAKAGDAVLVTGELGRAASALRALADEASPDAAEKLLRISPRLGVGRLLAESGAATSCMDSSDGLGAALGEMARQSGVHFEIAWERLPLDAGLAQLDPEAAREAALHFGGDYELVTTVRPSAVQGLQDAAEHVGERLTVIGSTAEGGRNILLTESGEAVLEDRGWEHFR